jgi:small-conductance mechanosensitive channel
MRSQIAEFRPDFDAARGANAERIATLEAQLEAFGPAPENGEELPEIRENREELNRQLEALRAPVRVANSAFLRAEGLVAEIDGIIRERQARRLLSLGPSPLDVRIWPTALADVIRIFKEAASDVAVPEPAFGQPDLSDRLPLLVFLVLVSLVLIVRGRRWAAFLIEYMRRFGGRGSGVWRFLASLLRIFIPLAGIYLLTYALRMTELFGPITSELLRFMPIFGLILLGFRWLAERLYARDEEDAVLPLSAHQRKLSRFFMLVLSLLFVARGLTEVFFGLEAAKPETVAVVNFPLVAMMGLVLVLHGLNLRGRSDPPVGDDDGDSEPQEQTGLTRVIYFASRAMIVVGAVAPVMAAIGYAEAGNAMLYPTILSMLLLGLVVVLHRFLVDVYGLITGQGEAARDGLTAVFAAFVLSLAALPFMALVWGARVADLTELWTQFLQGFDIGGTRISPSNFMTFAIVFAIGYTVTRLLQSTLRQSVLPKTRIDIGGQNALVSGTGYIGIFLAALIAVTVAGLDLSGLAIVAGALSVGIGFGLQTIVSNFVSGIILLIERPISEGDWIDVGGEMGYVRDISVRSTRIETFDRTDVIIPNADLVSGKVTNYTRGNTVGRLIVKVGVAYGTDTKKVDRLLMGIAKTHPMVLAVPAPTVIFVGFGADALEFEVRMFLRDVNWVLNVKSDVNHEIAKVFKKEGIEIPFAQRDVWLRNPEALRPETPAAPAADERKDEITANTGEAPT